MGSGTVDAIRVVLQDPGADRLDILSSAAEDPPSHLPPLFVAVSSRDPAKVDLLLESGARLDVRGPDGLPILMHAYRQRQIGLADHLFSPGADFRAADHFATR